MLSHLRKRAELILAQTHRAMLSTCGPAEIQTDCFDCTAIGMRLYMEVPFGSDHLFNLESRASVVVSAPGLHLRGWGHVVAPVEAPLGLSQGSGERAWRALVEVHPTRLQLLDDGGAVLESLDVSEEPSSTACG